MVPFTVLYNLVLAYESMAKKKTLHVAISMKAVEQYVAVLLLTFPRGFSKTIHDPIYN